MLNAFCGKPTDAVTVNLPPARNRGETGHATGVPSLARVANSQVRYARMIVARSLSIRDTRNEYHQPTQRHCAPDEPVVCLRVLVVLGLAGPAQEGAWWLLQ